MPKKKIIKPAATGKSSHRCLMTDSGSFFLSGGSGAFGLWHHLLLLRLRFGFRFSGPVSGSGPGCLGQPAGPWLNFRKFRLVSVRHEHVRHAGGYDIPRFHDVYAMYCNKLPTVSGLQPPIHIYLRSIYPYIHSRTLDTLHFIGFCSPRSALSDYFHIFRAVRHVFYLLSRWHFAWLTMDAWCE